MVEFPDGPEAPGFEAPTGCELPNARHNKSSPIYGMPILDADKARTVMVCKRSLNPGFAGIENELFARDNCVMLFGDAKAMITAIVTALKESH